jgi:four helix bundle protein
MIKLEDLKVYKIATEIGELVWNIREKWNFYQKDTLGKQFARTADSTALNISEEYGRFDYAENRNFCWYSRGAAFEKSAVALEAKNRNLLSEDEYNLLSQNY